jgi:hypothetical protein
MGRTGPTGSTALDSGASFVSLLADVSVTGGRSASVAGSGAPASPIIPGAFDVSMLCDGECAAALACNIDTRGGDIVLSGTYSGTSSNGGSGGSASVAMMQNAAADTRRKTSLSVIETDITLQSGGCSADTTPASVLTDFNGYTAGSLSVTQSFASPSAPGQALATAQVYFSGKVVASGGSCEYTSAPFDSSLVAVYGGLGGQAAFTVANADDATLDFQTASFDLRGGGVHITGSTSSAYTAAGSGGSFVVDATDVARLSFVDSLIDMSGGATQADDGYNSYGGDAGIFRFLALPDPARNAAMSTLEAVGSSQVRLSGGNVTSTGSLTALQAGSGGQLRTGGVTANYPATFSSCVYPTDMLPPSGGTAMGGSTANNGATGICDFNGLAASR